MRKLILTTVAAATVASANATVIANLYNDYTGTDFSGAVAGTTTFSTNNWSFFHGYEVASTTELTYASATLGTDGGTGFGDTSANGGFGQTALVSAEGVFDGVDPVGADSELTFHGSNIASNPGSDLLIRWTADQDYLDGIEVSYELRTPSGSAVGYALGINGTLLSPSIVTNWGSAGTSGTSGEVDFAALGSISSGDTVDIVIFRNGNFNGDQTFGNFEITAVPEPSIALLGALGMLGLIRRRR